MITVYIEYIRIIAALEMKPIPKVMVISFQYDQIHLKKCLFESVGSIEKV
jgi:hypothetical protein